MVILTINITKEVIAKAADVVEDDIPTKGPIPLAVARLFPNVMFLGDIFFSINGSSWWKIDVPPETWYWEHDFDNMTPAQRRLVQPYSFKVEMFNWAVDLIGIGKVRSRVKGSKTMTMAEK